MQERGFAHVFVIIGIVILIAIAGWWMWRNDKLNITVESPTPTPTSFESVEEIPDDWKTYTNEKYGFSFRYPSDYKLSSTSYIEGEELYSTSFIAVAPGDSEKKGRLTINVVKNKELTQNVDENLVSTQDDINLNPIVPGSTKRFQLNGVQGLATDRKTKSGGEMRVNVLIKEDKEAHIDISGIYQSDRLKLSELDNLEILNQILSTFKFTK